MYSGFSKEDGAVIGSVQTISVNLDLNDALDALGAEESLIAEDDNGDEIVMQAVLDSNSGQLVWNPSKEVGEAKCRTVAMSQMTSMLRDTYRNNVYEAAIQTAVKSFIETYNRPPVVLDIGTGTGLLALLAKKHGAQLVYGVEMFESMAKIAEETVARNNCTSGEIMIINGKSTDIEALPIAPDMLVSELLDSALLGESVLVSHGDAINRLMNNENQQMTNESSSFPSSTNLEPYIIPNRGEVYATLVECPALQEKVSSEFSWMRDMNLSPHRNEHAKDCHGGWSQLPIHWERYQQLHDARCLSASTLCLRVSFCDEFGGRMQDQAGEATVRAFVTDVTAREDGVVHGVLLWWRVYLLPRSLDPNGEICYATQSTAFNPHEHFEHSAGAGRSLAEEIHATNGYTQDHWQQTIFPLPAPVVCRAGEVLQLQVSHDDTNIWLKTIKPTERDLLHAGKKRQRKQEEEQLPRTREERREVSLETADAGQSLAQQVRLQPEHLKVSCSCGWHLLCSAHRMEMLHDSVRYRDIWGSALQRALGQLQLSQQTSTSSTSASMDMHADSRPAVYALDVSDGSVLAMIIGRLMRERGVAGRVISLEQKQFSKIFFQQLLEANRLDDRQLVVTWDGGPATEQKLPADADRDLGQELVQSLAETLAQCELSEREDTAQMESDQLEVEVTVPPISLLVSECYYYQMHALPTLQALRFYYQRRAMHPLLSADCRVLPALARVMVMPVQLDDLRHSHGTLQEVHGFDMSAIDDRQRHWHEYQYPYQLANYSKKCLAPPLKLAEIEYQDIEKPQFTQPIMRTTPLHGIPGRCDAIAIWVDYQLFEDDDSQLVVRHFNGEEFAPYVEQTVKFFETPREVQGNEKFCAMIALPVGSSEFCFQFDFLPADA